MIRILIRTAAESHNTMPLIKDGKGTPKNFCDKDIAELSGELSGGICLTTLNLPQNPCFIGWCPRIVQKILWCSSCDFLALGFFFGP